MKNTSITLLTLFTIILSSSFQLKAQQKMMATAESNISIYGTSNVHDWSEHVNTMNGAVSITSDGQALSTIASLSFNTKVEAIKSGKETMDEYTYEALKYEDHPNISFQSSNVQINKVAGKEGSYHATAVGTMTIAGSEKKEIIEATCTMKERTLRCEGVKKIDMTTYNVEPPSIMFGAMTVGKEVDVHFETIYQ